MTDNPLHTRFWPVSLFLLSLLLAGVFPVKTQAQRDDTSEEAPATVFEPVESAYGPIRVASDVAVQMRDGISLSLDIYLPDTGDSHSTLYAAGPYPHTSEILADSAPGTGPVAWYTSRGFAVVVANVRGTGLSGGDYQFLSREEQQDHYEAIEWIAEQPWSDGQVAGVGAGYYAAAQWQMAIQNPPHLSCIAPINGVLDPLREWITPGGLANGAFINGWYDRKVRLANAYSAEAPRLVNYDMRLSQLANPYDGDYWRIRSSLDFMHLINVPVFALYSWQQNALHPRLATLAKAMSGLNVTNKLLITETPEAGPLQQDMALLAGELLPYYEWCFGGRDSTSAFIEKPRVRYQVRGQSSIKPESTWPPGNMAHEAWYLGAANDQTGTGRLARNPIGNLTFTPLPDVTGENLRFISPPLENDLELAGPVMLELYASTPAPDMAFRAILSEELVYQPLSANPLLPSFLSPDLPQDSVAQASTYVRVTTGQLKASARTTGGASGEFSPVYSLEGKAAVGPGEVTRLDISLRQTAYRFKAGNRLVLDIVPVTDGSLPASSAGNLVYHGVANPSRLWLPVVQSPRISGGQPGSSPAPAIRTNESSTEPTFDFLDREAMNALNGDPVENPVIFVPQ